MYLICGSIVAFVALVCVIFLVRAYKTGAAIGMDTKKMKQTMISSATFSVLPSVGILLGVIALSGSLGTQQVRGAIPAFMPEMRMGIL